MIVGQVSLPSRDSDGAAYPMTFEYLRSFAFICG
jgi:hypothetical protein